MTQLQLKQFLKSLNQPGWLTLIFLNVVLLCLACLFVVLVMTQRLIWNTRSNSQSQPATITVTTQPSTSQSSKVLPKVYTVQAGESLWSIAQKLYGNGEKYTSIIEANILREPNHLFVGQELKIPELKAEITIDQTNEVQDPAATGSRLHTVQSGESLWQISGDYLATPGLWPVIYQLNADLIGRNPDLIFPGQQLTLPPTLLKAK